MKPAAATTLALAALCACALGAPVQPCRIEVVEKGTNWPVPMVELKTTNGVRFVTDNARGFIIRNCTRSSRRPARRCYFSRERSATSSHGTRR